MENYQKGKCTEETLSAESIPIPNLPPDFVWMNVRAGSKMSNLLSFALRNFQVKPAIVWSGSGEAVTKTISCAEITKKRLKGLHQVTQICYRKVEETFEPTLEGLDALQVVRNVPTIHILLSKEEIDTSEPGYQSPVKQSCFWYKNPKKAGAKKSQHQNNKGHSSNDNSRKRTKFQKTAKPSSGAS